MSLDPTRNPPSAAELDKLVAAFRDNPRSTAFVPLADAYVALGRAREAIEVLTRGLATHPDHAEGRVGLGRAYATIHQWKEAQAELLKAVKLDRANREGFRLLGEVLMRRNDYERALPVLQHAMNLDPADSRTLAMLKRAREGKPLDAPAPIPTPIAPQKSGPMSAAPAARPRPSAPSFDAEPTKLADDSYQDQFNAASTDSGVEEISGVGLASVDEPATNVQDDPASRRAPPPAPMPMPMPIAARPAPAPAPPPRPAPPPPPRPAPPPPRASAQALAVEEPLPAPPPPRARPAERPRVEAAPHKEQNAGAAAMRHSAAMGEDYLNQLLGAGLLSVPNVEAKASPEDLAAARRWSRATRRSFVYLFIVLFVAVGGGGAYIVLSKQKRDREVKQHMTVAATKMATGRSGDYADAEKEIKAAMRLDRSNASVAATLAEAQALDLLMFGNGDLKELEQVLSGLGPRLRAAKGSVPGRREFAIAVAARDLASVDKLKDPQQAIAEAKQEITLGLEANPSDGTLVWLSGELALAVGDRDGARAAFEKADAAGKGPAIARIRLGDLALDDGDIDAALDSYGKALKRSDQNPLALVGEILANTEKSADPEVSSQLNVGLDKAPGKRVEAWRNLAGAALQMQLQDYDKAGKALDAAAQSGLTEPRFVARIALARIDRGANLDATRLRNGIRYYGDAPARDPLMALLDAELYLASGMPDETIASLGQLQTTRAHIVRGRALLDAGKSAEAAAEFKAVIDVAKDDVQANSFLRLARVIGKNDPSGAIDELRTLARKNNSGLPRYVLAEADLALGQLADAKRDLTASVDEAADNPLAYRAHTRLAELALADADASPAVLADADKSLTTALAQSPLYVPAHAAKGRLLLKQGKPGDARNELEAVVGAGRATPRDEIAYAEALIATGSKDEAKKVLKSAKDHGAPEADLSRLAAAIDPTYPAELGVPAPAPSKDDKSAPKK